MRGVTLRICAAYVRPRSVPGRVPGQYGKVGQQYGQARERRRRRPRAVACVRLHGVARAPHHGHFPSQVLVVLGLEARRREQLTQGCQPPRESSPLRKDWLYHQVQQLDAGRS